MIQPTYTGEYPDPNIDPKLKGKQYIMNYGMAMYHSFRNSGYNIFYNSRREYRDLMAYAMGNQSINQYKERLDVWKDQDKSWMNLDWQILNLCSKFVNVVHGKLNKTDFNVVATAVDALAMDQKREYKAKLDAYVELKGWMNTIGVDSSKYFAEDPDISLDPIEQEIKLNMNLKHYWCMQMEKAIKHILNNNDFKELRHELIWDLIVLGVGALKITERREGLPKIEKVNPENLIVSYTEFPNFRELQHAGEVKFMTPNEFFERAGKEFNPDQRKDIMNRYAKIRPRYSHDEGSNTMPTNIGEGRMIEVVDFFFLSPDAMVHEKKKDKRGNSKIYRKPYNYPSDAKEYEAKYDKEREVFRTSYDCLYKGLWIIGSDYICDYGKVENANIDDCYDNVIPYVIMAPNMKFGITASLVKQMIPVLNMIQINWLRYNDVVAKYIPKGAFIDLDALEDVAIGKGGKNMTKKEIIDLYFKRGILAGRRKNMANKGAHGMPIEELENGMSRDVVTFFNNILNGINILRQIIGVNEVTDASTPDPKMLKSLAQAADMGTNNALDYLYHGVNSTFEYLCKGLSSSVLNAHSRGIDLGFDQAIGTGSVKFFGENSDITSHKFGIALENKPSEEEWNQFYQSVMIAVENQQITVSDDAFIREIDNLKEARQYLIWAEKRQAKQKAQEAQGNIQATAQAQQQSAAAASQMKQQEISMESQAKIELEKQKAETARIVEQEKRKTLELQYRLELEMKQLLLKEEGIIKSAHIAQEAGHDLIKGAVSGDKSKNSSV